MPTSALRVYSVCLQKKDANKVHKVQRLVYNLDGLKEIIIILVAVCWRIRWGYRYMRRH